MATVAVEGAKGCGARFGVVHLELLFGVDWETVFGEAALLGLVRGFRAALGFGLRFLLFGTFDFGEDCREFFGLVDDRRGLLFDGRVSFATEVVAGGTNCAQNHESGDFLHSPSHSSLQWSAGFFNKVKI